MTTDDDRDWTMLDSEDIATLLKCSRSQAYRLAHQIRGHLTIGRMVRVPRWAFVAWLEEKTQGNPDGKRARREPARAGPRPVTAARASSSASSAEVDAFWGLDKIPRPPRGRRSPEEV